VNFADHVWNHRNADGSYDLEAAELDRALDITGTPQEVAKLAAKAAKQERSAWMSQETASLRRQFAQPALSPELELDVMVPLGNGTAVRLGDMNRVRISIRRDMRRRTHEDEVRAYAAEVTHWEKTEQLLQSGETVEGAILRGQSVAA
jgi:hypothetical protein